MGLVFHKIRINWECRWCPQQSLILYLQGFERYTLA